MIFGSLSRPWVCLALMLGLVGAPTVGAELIIAADGDDGTDGGPGLPGTPGEPGVDLEILRMQLLDELLLVGGRGGVGGGGGPAVAPGAFPGGGADGGSGSAVGLQLLRAGPPDDTSVFRVSVDGGRGGAGGSGGAGAPSGGPGGAAGDGGAGGGAAALVDPTLMERVASSASVRGANGGAGGVGGSVAQAGSRSGAGGDGGDGGDAAANGFRDVLASGGAGGSGGNTGAAFGGGELGPSGGGGRGGNAQVHSDISTSRVFLRAEGGNGGAGRVGGAGGDGSVGAAVTSAGAVDVRLNASGGAGGSGEVEAGSGGIGEIIEAFGESTDGGDVLVEARVRGGRGGSAAAGPPESLPGKVGTAVSLHDVIDGTTTGSLVLTQVATAGESGLSRGVRGPTGASATSIQDRVETRAANVHVTSAAFAGSGSSRVLGGEGSDGGRADARVDITSTSGAAATSIGSIGGRGGGHLTDGIGGRGGDAFASQRAETFGDQQEIRIGALAPTLLSDTVQGGAGGCAAVRAICGAGGDAESHGVAVAHGDSEVDVRVAAFGGAGGGASLLGFGAESIQGGIGGTATARAEGRAAGSAPVVVRVRAAGGPGGGSVSVDAAKGGAASATAHAESAGSGPAHAEVEVFGGSGGASGEGGSGADGLAVDVTNAVFGATDGLLSLAQLAVGGAGGDGQVGGAGGSAMSNLSWDGGRAGEVHLFSEAWGGWSGSSGSEEGTTAGDALASAFARGDAQPIQITARAVGGVSVLSGGSPGRAGQAQLGRVEAISDGGADVHVTGIVISGAVAARELDAIATEPLRLVNAVHGATSGGLTLRQRARAGSSLNPINPFGAGGAAHSQLDRDVSSRELTLISESFGGWGGVGLGFFPPGPNFDAPGGAAESTVVATNRTGNAEAMVLAVGGGGELGGSATGRAEARTFTDGARVRVGQALGEFIRAPSAVAQRPFEPLPEPTFGVFGGFGERGGSASSESLGVAEGRSAVEVNDLAAGGDARFLERIPFLTELSTGSARSRAEAVSAGVEAIARSTAVSGTPTVRSSGVLAGEANANASAFSNGLANASALALSGKQGDLVPLPSPSELRFIETTSDGAALSSAVAHAEGLSGRARAESITSTQNSWIRAVAEAPASPSGGSAASVVVGGALRTGDRPVASTSVASALIPDDASVGSVMQAASSVMAMTGPNAQWIALGSVSLGGAASESDRVRSATVDIDFGAATLEGRAPLALGVFDAELTGMTQPPEGWELIVSLSLDEELIHELRFDNPETARTYFRDRAFGLGSIAADATPASDARLPSTFLRLLIDVELHAAGDPGVFKFDFIVGHARVPEPLVGLLLALACLALARRRASAARPATD